MNKTYLIALAIFLIGGIGLFAMLAIFLAPSGFGVALAPPDDLDAETLRVSKELYCPVCPGTPLDVCETQACQQWRALIRQKLEAGETPSQIQAYFIEQYGERVLGAPRAQGLNLLVYLLPAFVVSGGAALLYLFAHRRVKPPVTALAQTSDVPDEYRLRVERELHENE